MKYLLTDAGAELLAKLGVTGKGLHFTRAQASGGYSDEPKALTELIDNGLIDLQIVNAKKEDATVILMLSVSNHEFADEHKIQQIGIFVRDDEAGQEVLLIIGQDLNGDVLPAIDYGRVEYRYVVNIKISNAMNVTIDINDTDFLLQQTFYELCSDETIEKAFYAVYTNAVSDGEVDEIYVSSEV